MMIKQRLILAAGLVALMIALVVVFGRQQQPQTGGEREAWLPQLKPALGEVQRIALQAGSERVVLNRGEKGWGVEQRAGYPVDFARLEEFLRALAEARVLEQKTARAEFLERLDLNDIEQPGSKAVLVEIWAGGEEAEQRVLIGKRAEGRGGRYVRHADQDQSWLIDQSPEPLTDPADWIERRFIGVDFERVQRVTRTPAEGEGFVASRAKAEGSPLVAEALPAGRKPRYESVFDAAARAVLSAEIEDARPLAEIDFSAAGTARTQIDCFDGLSLVIDTLKNDSGNWVRVTASEIPVAVEAAQEPAGEAESSDEATQAGDDRSAAAEGEPDATGIAQEVTELNQRLGGWAFKVSDYVAGESSKALAEYLEEEQADDGNDDADAG